jgi:hypothetical protein
MRWKRPPALPALSQRTYNLHESTDHDVLGRLPQNVIKIQGEVLPNDLGWAGRCIRTEELEGTDVLLQLQLSRDNNLNVSLSWISALAGPSAIPLALAIR